MHGASTRENKRWEQQVSPSSTMHNIQDNQSSGAWCQLSSFLCSVWGIVCINIPGYIVGNFTHKFVAPSFDTQERIWSQEAWGMYVHNPPNIKTKSNKMIPYFTAKSAALCSHISPYKCMDQTRSEGDRKHCLCKTISAEMLSNSAFYVQSAQKWHSFMPRLHKRYTDLL